MRVAPACCRFSFCPLVPPGGIARHVKYRSARPLVQVENSLSFHRSRCTNHLHAIFAAAFRVTHAITRITPRNFPLATVPAWRIRFPIGPPTDVLFRHRWNTRQPPTLSAGARAPTLTPVVCSYQRPGFLFFPVAVKPRWACASRTRRRTGGARCRLEHSHRVGNHPDNTPPRLLPLRRIARLPIPWGALGGHLLSGSPAPQRGDARRPPTPSEAANPMTTTRPAPARCLALDLTARRTPTPRNRSRRFPPFDHANARPQQPRRARSPSRPAPGASIHPTSPPPVRDPHAQTTQPPSDLDPAHQTPPPTVIHCDA